METYQVQVIAEATTESVASYDAEPWAPDQTRGIWRLNWGSVEARHPLGVVPVVVEELRETGVRIVEVTATTPDGYWQFTGQSLLNEIR